MEVARGWVQKCLIGICWNDEKREVPLVLNLLRRRGEDRMVGYG